LFVRYTETMQLTFIYLRESFAYVLLPVNVLLFTTMAPSSNQLMHPGYSVEIKTRNQYSETLVRGFGKKIQQIRLIMWETILKGHA